MKNARIKKKKNLLIGPVSYVIYPWTSTNCLIGQNIWEKECSSWLYQLTSEDNLLHCLAGPCAFTLSFAFRKNEKWKKIKRIKVFKLGKALGTFAASLF
jgi:hypothetical protein